MALVGAAWTVFDRVVESAPLELRKGPRGGGRNRDKMVVAARRSGAARITGDGALAQALVAAAGPSRVTG